MDSIEPCLHIKNETNLSISASTNSQSLLHYNTYSNSQKKRLIKYGYLGKLTKCLNFLYKVSENEEKN